MFWQWHSFPVPSLPDFWNDFAAQMLFPALGGGKQFAYSTWKKLGSWGCLSNGWSRAERESVDKSGWMPNQAGCIHARTWVWAPIIISVLEAFSTHHACRVSIPWKHCSNLNGSIIPLPDPISFINGSPGVLPHDCSVYFGFNKNTFGKTSPFSHQGSLPCWIISSD